MTPTQRASIVYDGDCPFCSRYVKLVRLREALGSVDLVNARDGGRWSTKSGGRDSISTRAWC